MKIERAMLGRTAGAILLFVGLSSGTAVADESGWYLGGDFGFELHTYSESALSGALASDFARSDEGLSLTSTTLRNARTLWSADVGDMVSPYFSVEASYLDLAELKYQGGGTGSSPYYGTAPVLVNIHIKSQGPALALVGVLPLSDAWQVNVRAGAYEGKTTTDYATLATAGSASETSTSLMAGVGCAYILGSHWMLRLDYLHLDHLDEKTLGTPFNVDLVKAGVAYVF